MRISHEGKGRPVEKKIPVVVVYKKPTGKKYYMLITEEEIDQVINPPKKNSLLPDNFEIVDMGVGESFILKFKKQYNIK